MSSAQALIRKLLLKVHPDVLASHSEQYRLHNEKNLKILLDLNKNKYSSDIPKQKIFFYLRDGGRTPSVVLDRNNPTTALRNLLGEGITKQNSASSRHSHTCKQLIQDENDIILQELQRVMHELQLRKTRSEHSPLALLFINGRIRFVPDAFDNSKVSKTEIAFELKNAVDLLHETLQYYCHPSTLKLLRILLWDRL